MIALRHVICCSLSTVGIAEFKTLQNTRKRNDQRSIAFCRRICRGVRCVCVVDCCDTSSDSLQFYPRRWWGLSD